MAQNARDFATLIHYATKAPSGHNAQPWKFAINATNIVKILPDHAKALPIVDASKRELYISLGCALENLYIAAPHFGYAAHIEKQNAQEIAIRLEKTPDVPKSELFFQIEKRQTNRRIYQDKTIPDEIIWRLQTLPMQENNRVHCFAISSPAARTIGEYVARGNQAQLGDSAFRQELLHWLRFNSGEARAGDGLTHKVMGFPPTPRFLGKRIVSAFLKPDRQNASELKKINSASHLAVFTTQNNTATQWIDLGRSLERFLLTATGFGIASAYINQPCEIASLARELASKIPALNNEHPAIALRMGYADPAPRAPRKNVEEIIFIQ
jgi:nitroreductase